MDQNNTGLLKPILLTIVVLLVTVWLTVTAIRMIAPKIDFLNIFENSKTYELKKASNDLPVIRGKDDTIGISHLLEFRELLKNESFEKLNTILEE